MYLHFCSKCFMARPLSLRQRCQVGAEGRMGRRGNKSFLYDIVNNVHSGSVALVLSSHFNKVAFSLFKPVCKNGLGYGPQDK